MPNQTSKIKLRSIAVGILCIVIGAVIVMAIGTNHALRSKHLVTVELYYMNQDNQGMGKETKQIPLGSEMEMLDTVLKELKSGSKTEGAIAPVPKDVTFLDVTLDNGLVILEISPDYNLLSPGSEMICRASIVWTLTSLDFVKHVAIQVNGQPLLKADGTPIGNMNRENVVIDTVVSPEIKRYETFELYFASESGEALTPEKREIEVSQNKPKERSIMEQLIAGPNGEDHGATIPVDTKIRDITTTDDGICYVNLSAEFINKKSNTNESNALTIYSVVNSLTGLPYIDKVQFLIEGEKVEKNSDSVDISKPLQARPGLVQEKS